MSIDVTVRHAEAMDDMQKYAEERAAQIMAEFPHCEHLHVIMDIQKHLHIAEIIVQAGHHVRVDAKEASDNMRVSLDTAVDKVERQLRKLRDKVQDHTATMKHFEAERIRRTEGVE